MARPKKSQPSLSKRSKSVRKMKSKSRKVKKSRKQKECIAMVSKKIAINMKEFKDGLNFVSPKQAIAVAYSQVKKKSPGCAKYFSRK